MDLPPVPSVERTVVATVRIVDAVSVACGRNTVGAIAAHFGVAERNVLVRSSELVQHSGPFAEE